MCVSSPCLFNMYTKTMNSKKTMLVSKYVTSTRVSVNIDGDHQTTTLGQTLTSNGKCDDEILKIIEIARIIKACVVDTFIRMLNVDCNHQKYDKIAIV